MSNRWILLIMVLLLFSLGCSGGAPSIELVKAPTEAFARTQLTFEWEVIPSNNFASATQFTLHIDELSHSGKMKPNTLPTESSYSRIIEGDSQVLDTGSIRLSFPIYEAKPTLLYYRLHVNIDGRHYWTPEGMLNIKHKPALTEEFKESFLSESVDDLTILG